MSREVKQVQKWNAGTIVIKRFKVFDALGSTAHVLTSGTWGLYDISDGSLVMSGSYTENNSDSDLSGNTIKTVSVTVDLTLTDAAEVGNYYLIVHTALTSGQTDIFRFPVEIVDYRTKGVA